MRGALVAAGLLLTVLAFALAFLPRRVALLGSGLAVVTAIIAAVALPPPGFNWAFAGCWLSLIGTALVVYFPQTLRRYPIGALLLAANAGLWAGIVVVTENTPLQAAPVLAVLLLGFPAAYCIGRGWALAPRIVTSWLLAVALLVGSIPYLVVHPGYEPDHRE